MSQYTLYKLYVKQQRPKGDTGATWVEVVPTTYSVDGEGTQTPVVVEEYSEQCGYSVPTDVQYRWKDMDMRFNYYCEGTTKFYKQKKQMSVDGGLSWTDVMPYEYNKGAVVETDCPDCGGFEPMYKWEQITPTSDPNTYWCDDCIQPFVGKFKAYYRNDERILECDGNPVLSSLEVRPTMQYAHDLILAQIGDCVASIGEQAFILCSGMTNIEIPDTVSIIGASGFGYCYSLTSATIGNGVTSIGDRAFIGCRSLTSCTIGNSIQTIGAYCFGGCHTLTGLTLPSSVTTIGTEALRNCRDFRVLVVEATTPPTLGTNALPNSESLAIYVPTASINTYKAASGWSDYANRIYPI